MTPPYSRKEFEHNIDILVENITMGRFQMVPDPKLLSGLMNARMLPNRRTNFLTIDESTRLLANSLAHFDRSEFKKTKHAD